ncbi:MAG TPA: serine/threonine-protein kinase [Myxococcales bacterium]|nr:serine/threonine-protein kinase [Myxococcales bacterium]
MNQVCARCQYEIDPQAGSSARCLCKEPLILQEDLGGQALDLDWGARQAVDGSVEHASAAPVERPPAPQPVPVAPEPFDPLEVAGRAAPWVLTIAALQELFSVGCSLIGYVLQHLNPRLVDYHPAGTRVSSWMLSVAVMVCWMLWILRGRERRGGPDASRELQALLLAPFEWTRASAVFRGVFPELGRARFALTLQLVGGALAVIWLSALAALHPAGVVANTCQLVLAAILCAAMLVTRSVMLDVQAAEQDGARQLPEELVERAAPPQAQTPPPVPASPRVQTAPQVPAPPRAQIPAPARAQAGAAYTATTDTQACVACGGDCEDYRCVACGAARRAGAFQIMQLLSESGHARTYLARNVRGAKFVLKELCFAAVPDAKTIESFKREGELLEALSHPAIPRFVSSFAAGSGPGLRFYLAQEHVEGRTLLEEIDRPRDETPGGAQRRESLAAQVLREVLEALRYLHTHNPRVFHRDVKPANLILRRDGHVALIDFGAAIQTNAAVHDGTLVGTFGYMPPQQLAGQVDETSDLYAAGATAIHLLTRRAPRDLLRDGVVFELPKGSISPRLAKFLLKLTARQSKARFQTAEQALAALERVLAKPSRRSRAVPAIAAAAAAALAAAVYYRQAILPDLAEAPATAIASAVPQAAEASAKPAVEVKPAAQAPAPPAPAVDDSPVLARYEGGVVTLNELNARLRATPEWLKCDSISCYTFELNAMIARRLLVQEAKKRGVLPSSGQREVAERLGIRNVIAQEGSGASERSLHAAFDRLANKLAADANISFVKDEMLLSVPMLHTAAPLPDADRFGTPLPPGRFTVSLLANAEDCVINLEPRTRTYGGRCGALESLTGGLDPFMRLYLELFHSGTIPSFPENYLFDGITYPPLQYRGPDPHAPSSAVEAAWFAELLAEPPEGTDDAVDLELSIQTIGGSLQREEVQRTFEQVRPALRHCLINMYWKAEVRPAEQKGALRIDYREGKNGAVFELDTGAAHVPGACGKVLSLQPLQGTGRLEVSLAFAKFPPRDLSKRARY